MVQYADGMHAVYSQNFVARKAAGRRGVRIIGYNATVEFNFFDIGESKYYKARYHATPYIVLGIGLTTYSDLYSGGNAYKVNIPFGIGGKWRINRRWTLGLEWTIHKLFIDNFDVTNANNKVLDNPYQVPSVGFFDTDFYSIANLYITFNLFDTNKYCR